MNVNDVDDDSAEMDDDEFNCECPFCGLRYAIGLDEYEEDEEPDCEHFMYRYDPDGISGAEDDWEDDDDEDDDESWDEEISYDQAPLTDRTDISAEAIAEALGDDAEFIVELFHGDITRFVPESRVETTAQKLAGVKVGGISGTSAMGWAVYDFFEPTHGAYVAARNDVIARVERARTAIGAIA